MPDTQTPQTSQTQVNQSSGSSGSKILLLVGCSALVIGSLLLMCCCAGFYILQGGLVYTANDLDRQVQESLDELEEELEATVTPSPTRVVFEEDEDPSSQPITLDGNLSVDITDVDDLVEGEVYQFRIVNVLDDTLVQTEDFVFTDEMVSVDSQGNASISFDFDPVNVYPEDEPLYLVLLEVVPNSLGEPRARELQRSLLQY